MGQARPERYHTRKQQWERHASVNMGQARPERYHTRKLVLRSSFVAFTDYRYFDLETPLQSECTVSGALSFVLHVSRIAAIAPIKFQKVRGGWRISLSRIYYAYTILFVIISHIITGFTTFDAREELKDGYEASSNKQSMPVLTAVLHTIGIVVGISIAVTGDKRLRYMINCLFYLEQLNKKLDHLNAPSSSYTETKTWFKVFFLFINGYVGSFLDYGIYLYDVIAANNNVPWPAIFNVSAFLYLLHLQLLSIQVNLVITCLVSTQHRLNSCLESLLEKLRDDCSSVPVIESSSSTNENKDKEIRINIRNAISHNFIKVFSPSAVRGSKTNLNLLRKLINIYCSLCNLIKLLNEGNGVALIMMLLYSTSYMVTGPYFVVTVMYRTKSELPVFKIVSIVGWCILCFCMVLTVTEPCHQTHLQLEKTKHFVKQLMRYTPRDDSVFYHELKMFRYHISLNPVNFYSMQLLKFDRKLSMAVLSLVMTYLSVVISL